MCVNVALHNIPHNTLITVISPPGSDVELDSCSLDDVIGEYAVVSDTGNDVTLSSVLCAVNKALIQLYFCK